MSAHAWITLGIALFCALSMLLIRRFWPLG